MGDQVENSEEGIIKIVLRNLDDLMREKLGNDLIVDSFTTKNLVPFGENYGSSMLRVDLVVRRDGRRSEPEELSLVAKMTPPTEFQKMMFDSPFTFPKEIYMFKEIVPAYKALERECGILEEEVFDPLPELYGARLSLNDPTKFDHDAVILMENLKVKNYYCANRKIGVDLSHARLVVRTLARFHALGIAIKEKKPELFHEFTLHAVSMNFKDDMAIEMQQNLLQDLKNISAIAPHIDKVAVVLNRSNTEFWTKPPIEPWGSIAHTDLWTNNIMFQDGDNGDAENVKFIDFQNYLYLNPLRDLVFFLVSSCKKEVYADHGKNLVNLYFEEFTSHLARLACDVSLFSRNSFEEQYKNAANLEYMHCVFMTKVFLADGTNPADPNNTAYDAESLFNAESSSECQKRMAEITLLFLEEDWI